MNQFFSRVFLCFSIIFSIVIPSLLRAQTISPEALGNNPVAEAMVNTPSAQVGTALPEVVVTANRLDTPIGQVANSISVVTAQDIQNKQASTALDALQGVPGLTLLQNGAPGENSSIFIRGADAGHTLVLMDGIPLNNPISTDREFDNLDQLFTDDISQIEVVRGPLSTVYGTNATAGVINIITQQYSGPTKGSVLLEGGTYDTLREAATASGGSGQGNFNLSVSRFETDGFPSADKSFGNTVNNPDSNTTASLRLGILPLSNLDSSFFGRYVHSLTNVDANGGAFGDDPNYLLDETQWVAGNQTKLKLFNGDWEQVLSVSYMDDMQKFSDIFSSYPDSHQEQGVYEGQTAQLNWQNNIKLWTGETLVAGIQGQQEWGREDDTADYGYGPSETLIGQTMTTGSYFLESQTALIDRLFATLGGRLDAISSFGSQWTYRGAVAYYVPGLETKLKVTYGTGFKAPSLYQLYSPYGDPELKAENSQGWDAGFEQDVEKGKLGFGATYFHNDFNNLIEYDDDTNLYGNVAKATTEGWETYVSSKPIQNLELRANYTYTWAFDANSGEQLPRRPQNQAGFSANYHWKAVKLGFDVLYVGDRPDTGFAGYTPFPVTLPSYTLVNLMVSYQLDPTINLYGRIHNLFNENYEEVYGYGTAGQSFYAGTKVSF